MRVTDIIFLKRIHFIIYLFVNVLSLNLSFYSITLIGKIFFETYTGVRQMAHASFIWA